MRGRRGHLCEQDGTTNVWSSTSRSGREKIKQEGAVASSEMTREDKSRATCDGSTAIEAKARRTKQIKPRDESAAARGNYLGGGAQSPAL